MIPEHEFYDLRVSFPSLPFQLHFFTSTFWGLSQRRKGQKKSQNCPSPPLLLVSSSYHFNPILGFLLFPFSDPQAHSRASIFAISFSSSSSPLLFRRSTINRGLHFLIDSALLISVTTFLWSGSTVKLVVLLRRSFRFVLILRFFFCWLFFLRV